MTITEFLEARITEDEAIARAASWEELPGYDPEDEYSDPWSKEHGEFVSRGGTTFRHILHNNPSRVLAECAAKRAILADRKAIDRSAGMDDWYAGRSDANYDALHALAAVYKDHPDYRQEWAL